MLRTLFIPLLLALALAVTSVTPAPAQAASASNEELKAALRDLLRENPDLILQVLRDNSETVLEIAQQGSNVRRKKALIAQWQTDLTQPKKANLEGRPMRGPANAPVTIVAYSDFTCPYCQQAAGTMELLLANYKDKVRYVFKHMPLDSHDNARLASEYHVAAGLQDGKKAWAFYETVFRDREKLVAEGEPFLKKAAAEAGLDMKRLGPRAERAGHSVLPGQRPGHSRLAAAGPVLRRCGHGAGGGGQGQEIAGRSAHGATRAAPALPGRPVCIGAAITAGKTERDGRARATSCGGVPG